jgi:hypothetical protein
MKISRKMLAIVGAIIVGGLGIAIAITPQPFGLTAN